MTARMLSPAVRKLELCKGESGRDVRERRAFEPRERAGSRDLLVVAIALVVLAACTREQAPPAAFDVPNIKSWTGEPQVAAKIRRVRQEVLDAPDSAGVVGRLGMVFHAHELHAEAIACYRRAEELAPQEPRWPYVAALATAETDLGGAVGDFERAVALQPGRPAVHVSFGDVLSRLGRSEEAAEQYRQALALAPETTHALYGLAQAALGRGEVEMAAEHLERAATLASYHGEVHARLAQVYQRLGRTDDDERERLRAGAYPGSSRTPDPFLAEVWAEAVNSRAYTERGRRLAESGRFAAAEAEFRKVLEIRPGNARDFSNLGGALTGQEKLEEAIGQYRKALEVAPNDTYALNNLAMALAGQGDVEGAAEHLRRAIELESDYADAHRNLGLMHARQGRHEEAIDHYRAAIAANPSLARAHNDLGTSLAGRGEIEQAIEHWRQALEIDRRELSALHNLAVALIQGGEHREAVEWLRRGLETAPNSSRLVSLLAWELATAPDHSLRDAAEAERLARRVYNAFSDRPQMGDVLAAALAAQGRFDEAVAVAEGALAQARRAGQRSLEAQIGLHLNLYRRQRAYDQSLTSTAR